MKKILVTGGTLFVSKYIASYFQRNNEGYVLNRNTHPQLEGVHLIEADRHHLGDKLKDYHFDAIIDVCAYNGNDVTDLLSAVSQVTDYILISSSAVYPETNPQPFTEDQALGPNAIWGGYGTGKIAAEQALLSQFPAGYILRPPYLYGPMENVYREPFVFECALKGRKFYIPKDGKMKLQFFHVEDLCKVIETLLNTHPENHIFNVGNEELADINTFVALCYAAAGKPLTTVNVYGHENQRDYFCFHDYEYALDVSRQKRLLPETKPLAEGLQEAYAWYLRHPDEVMRKGYLDFIDAHFCATEKEHSVP